jgi:hypothetical protein
MVTCAGIRESTVWIRDALPILPLLPEASQGIRLAALIVEERTGDLSLIEKEIPCFRFADIRG